MPKSQIVGQFLGQRSRYDTPSVRRLSGHVNQKVSMPLVASGNLLVKSLYNGQEDVLQAVVERVQHRGHSCYFDQVRRALLDTFHEVSIDCEEPIDLSNLEGYLRNDVISQREATLLPFASIGQRRLARPNRQDQQGDPVPKAAGPTDGKNALEGILAQLDQYLIHS
jgi:hypothetical protein